MSRHPRLVGRYVFGATRLHLAVGALNAVGPLNNDDVIVMNDTNPLGAASAEPSSGKPSEQIELRIGGMTCPHCPPAVEKAVAAVPGVMSARVNLASNTARIRYEPARTKLAEVLQAIRSIGYVPGTATLRIPIKNMHCSSCSIRIELALQMTPGVYMHGRVLDRMRSTLSTILKQSILTPSDKQSSKPAIT